MKKIINNPENFVDEMLEGIYLAYSDDIKYVNDDLRCYVKKEKVKGKVGLVTGGGSGHLPVFLGYVGQGMLDGCAVGGVFQSPSSKQILEITKSVDSGEGVIYIYGNYTGDIFNFDMAEELASLENIKIEHVIVKDDVASGKKGAEDKRRGVAGLFYVYKCAGAASEQLLPINEVKRITEKAVENVRTMGVALTPCTIPEIGKPTFSIAEDVMEIGMGIHGEPGISTSKIMTADEITNIIMKQILDDMPISENEEVSVLVNGLGGTPKEELFIMYRKIHEILTERKINIYNNYIGEYATSMEMAGASISILKLDDELKRCINHQVNTPFFKQFGMR